MKVNEYWVTVTATVEAKIRVGDKNQAATLERGKLVLRRMLSDLRTLDDKPVKPIAMKAKLAK